MDQADLYQAGDINFFSACMAVGIPPLTEDGISPVAVIKSDDGRNYLSFSLASISECGRHSTQILNTAWSYPDAFRRENPGHAFGLLMDYVTHSRGRHKKADWIESAADFLGLTCDVIKKAVRQISDLEASSPESPLTYIVCFIENRFAAAAWAKSAIPKEVLHHGSSMVLMDGNLAKRKREFLLAHL